MNGQSMFSSIKIHEKFRESKTDTESNSNHHQSVTVKHMDWAESQIKTCKRTMTVRLTRKKISSVRKRVFQVKEKCERTSVIKSSMAESAKAQKLEGGKVAATLKSHRPAPLLSSAPFPNLLDLI